MLTLNKYILYDNDKANHSQDWIAFAGDEIIAINGRQVDGLEHQQVVALFREVRRGTLVIVAGRKLPKDKDGMYVTADQLAANIPQIPTV